MKAAYARAGHIEVDVADNPVPGFGQVLVRPLACGICGSDLHVLEMQASMPEQLPPIIPGHEFVGELIDYGPHCERRLPLGTAVTSVPYLDTAEGPQLLGLSPSAPGALAQRMVLQESRLVAVPDGSVARELIALAEPLAVGAHAVAAAGMRERDVALVVGCGPVGLAVIAALRAAGHGPVVASDFSPRRRELAERLGADVIVDPAETSPYTAWSELAGPALPPSPLLGAGQHANTVIFECVGVPGVLSTICESALPHTRIVVVGVCMQPDTFTPAIANTKELSFHYVFAYRTEEFATAVTWIAEGAIDIAPIVTAKLPLGDTARAFTQLRSPDGHGKILITAE
ncbi:zinc-binding dehydrogenase [Mycolicibacillus parakoreensis]|uniref:Zinc-binding dehydrogenase n=1 Tax=Mycolicibacillus parakoreensis TaxID=1069221 RepID=A0ABY3U8I1_9MYCO|nr:zinc-binding dehydrogenase [Mycolicibacillus parakoreensis]MCV7314102.1 zinc-binding dehydrogenase [Mycolicibacillus parakoreensis]ULN54047.1 zinc-binding dehydrogenase [Mycolicibacillus parakoreensis]